MEIDAIRPDSYCKQEYNKDKETLMSDCLLDQTYSMSYVCRDGNSEMVELEHCKGQIEALKLDEFDFTKDDYELMSFQIRSKRDVSGEFRCSEVNGLGDKKLCGANCVSAVQGEKCHYERVGMGLKVVSDLPYCEDGIDPGKPCGHGDKCCSGFTCQNGFCMNQHKCIADVFSSNFAETGLEYMDCFTCDDPDAALAECSDNACRSNVEVVVSKCKAAGYNPIPKKQYIQENQPCFLNRAGLPIQNCIGPNETEILCRPSDAIFGVSHVCRRQTDAEYKEQQMGLAEECISGKGMLTLNDCAQHCGNSISAGTTPLYCEHLQNRNKISCSKLGILSNKTVCTAN